MVTYKIGYDSNVASYADADLFSFPINPKIYDTQLDSQREIQELPYSQLHVLIDYGGVKPRSIILNGFFNGSTREASLDTLASFIYKLDSTGSGLLRFYFSATRFIYCFGKSLKVTNQGGRSSFIDYVANLICTIPFVYDDTLVSVTSTSITTNSAQNLSGTYTNAGTAPAHILQYTFTNNGSNNVTSVQIGDQAVSGSAVQGNQITWSGILAPGGVLTLYLFKVVNNVFNPLFYTVGSTISGSRDFSGVSAPFIPAGTTATFSIKVLGTSPNLAVNTTHRAAYWFAGT